MLQLLMAGFHTATATQQVKIQDTTGPVVTTTDIVAESTSPSGATVVFTATASDIVDGSVATKCVPASGSQFTIGTTTVTCTASDRSGNTNGASFQVTVLTPKQLIQDLIGLKDSMNFDKGTSTSLGAKLNAAYKSLSSGNLADAKNQLTAFINEVNAQTGKNITQTQASQLISAAQSIISAIG